MDFNFAIVNHKLMEFFRELNEVDALKYLNELDTAYYNGKPLIPDSSYDSIRKYCNMRFPSLKKKVGKSEKTENSVWPKESLSMAMGSLEKIDTHSELEKFLEKYTTGTVVFSHKVDGSSIELTYIDGVFSKAITRGDGFVGENVTPNVMKMQFPKSIKSSGVTCIRSEIVLFKADFENFFAPKGDKNPRNSAAGTVRRLDGVGSEHLRLIAFDIISDEVEFTTKIEKYKKLESLGFRVPQPQLVKGIDNIKALLEYNETNRKLIPYEIDGVVIDENDLSHAENMGVTDNRPKASKAYKFEAEFGKATLLDVKWQVGKIGAITPVGIITPTEIQGITITRVMLNNMDFINRKRLEIGCKVKIARANDVIPVLLERMD